MCRRSSCEVFVRNAVSSGTVSFAFLPDGFRQVAPWLSNGAIVSAARGVVHFADSHPGHPLLVLGIWLAERAAETYAMSGTAHLRRRLTLQLHQARPLTGMPSGRASHWRLRLATWGIRSRPGRRDDVGDAVADRGP
jgi:hypothetical protein